MNPAVDVFIDLGHLDAPIEPLGGLLGGWSPADSLASLAGRITVALSPSHLGQVQGARGLRVTEVPTGGRALAGAVAAAGRAGRDLLVLHDIVDVSGPAVASLRRELAEDPLIGFAVPRLACQHGCCVTRVTRLGLGGTAWVARDVLVELAERDLLPEMATPCVLVSAAVTGNFPDVDEALLDWRMRLLRYMAAARRCGFRLALSHRSVCRLSDASCLAPAAVVAPINAGDGKRLTAAVPDLEIGWQGFRGASVERFERLYEAAPPRGSGARSLLLDLRNLGPVFNGTTFALLGLANGLRMLDSGWEVAILASAPAIAFHSLKTSFPDWLVHREMPARGFTAAFRPSQPWHLSEMFELHGAARINAYLVLDTIAWDVIYPAPVSIDSTWRLLAEHADALLFDSAFSRQRFLYRFPVSDETRTAVTLLSCDPQDYVRPELVASRTADYILVIGNSLDHKDVERTVETLAAAFPYVPIKALGHTGPTQGMVEALASGSLPEAVLHRLYAAARAVVFPSFYEGFGFPVVTALAYGRTVLARRSTLLDELAGECAPRGRLFDYRTREELVRIIGRVLHDDIPASKPIGDALGGRPPRSWRDVAAATLHHLEATVENRGSPHWWRRDRAFTQALGARE